MNESRLWDLLKAAVLGVDPQADLTRHEDRLSLGTPDVSFGIHGIGGWTELKAYNNWPRDPGQPLPFANLKPWQRLWIKRRGRAGAPVSLLVAVGRKNPEFLLFDWRAVQDLGKLNRQELYEAASFVSVRRVDSAIAAALCDPTRSRASALPTAPDSQGRGRSVHPNRTRVKRRLRRQRLPA